MSHKLRFRTDHLRVCGNKCRSTQVVPIGGGKFIARHDQIIGRCDCYAAENLNFYYQTEQLKGTTFVLHPDLDPLRITSETEDVENPCETGTHLCHELAVCSFDGVNYKCICESHMHGNGIYCSGYEKLSNFEMDGISLWNAALNQGNVNVLLDLNVLGDSENGFDPQRCAEFSVVDWTVPEDIWSLQLQMIGRSYVKAVGFNNRGDDMAGSLNSDVVSVSICDFVSGFCRVCSGGRESISLYGIGGWNYVLCEEIGDQIRVEVTLSKLTNGTLIGFCEVAAFGIVVAPVGKIVLSTSNSGYSGPNQLWQEQMDLILDKLDGFDPEDECFLLHEQGVQGRSEMKLFLETPKFISHVQLLAPNDDSAMEMKGIEIYQCLSDEECSLCGVLKGSLRAKWTSVPCPEENFVPNMAKIVHSGVPVHGPSLYICDIEILGKDVEPRLEVGEIVELSNFTIRFKWQVDSSDNTGVIAILSPHHQPDTNLPEESGEAEITDLKGGTTYMLRLRPYLLQVFGDSKLLHFSMPPKPPRYANLDMQDKLFSGTLVIEDKFDNAVISISPDFQEFSFTPDDSMEFLFNSLQPNEIYTVWTMIYSGNLSTNGSFQFSTKPETPKVTSSTLFANQSCLKTFEALGNSSIIEYTIYTTGGVEVFIGSLQFDNIFQTFFPMEYFGHDLKVRSIGYEQSEELNDVICLSQIDFGIFTSKVNCIAGSVISTASSYPIQIGINPTNQDQSFPPGNFTNFEFCLLTANTLYILNCVMELGNYNETIFKDAPTKPSDIVVISSEQKPDTECVKSFQVVETETSIVYGYYTSTDVELFSTTVAFQNSFTVNIPSGNIGNKIKVHAVGLISGNILEGFICLSLLVLASITAEINSIGGSLSGVTGSFSLTIELNPGSQLHSYSQGDELNFQFNSLSPNQLYTITCDIQTLSVKETLVISQSTKAAPIVTLSSEQDDAGVCTKTFSVSGSGDSIKYDIYLPGFGMIEQNSRSFENSFSLIFAASNLGNILKLQTIGRIAGDVVQDTICLSVLSLDSHQVTDTTISGSVSIATSFLELSIGILPPDLSDQKFYPNDALSFNFDPLSPNTLYTVKLVVTSTSYIEKLSREIFTKPGDISVTSSVKFTDGSCRKSFSVQGRGTRIDYKIEDQSGSPVFSNTREFENSFDVVFGSEYSDHVLKIQSFGNVDGEITSSDICLTSLQVTPDPADPDSISGTLNVATGVSFTSIVVSIPATNPDITLNPGDFLYYQFTNLDYNTNYGLTIVLSTTDFTETTYSVEATKPADVMILSTLQTIDGPCVKSFSVEGTGTSIEYVVLNGGIPSNSISFANTFNLSVSSSFIGFQLQVTPIGLIRGNDFTDPICLNRLSIGSIESETDSFSGTFSVDGSFISVQFMLDQGGDQQTVLNSEPLAFEFLGLSSDTRYTVTCVLTADDYTETETFEAITNPERVAAISSMYKPYASLCVKTFKIPGNATIEYEIYDQKDDLVSRTTQTVSDEFELSLPIEYDYFTLKMRTIAMINGTFETYGLCLSKITSFSVGTALQSLSGSVKVQGDFDNVTIQLDPDDQQVAALVFESLPINWQFVDLTPGGRWDVIANLTFGDYTEVSVINYAVAAGTVAISQQTLNSIDNMWSMVFTVLGSGDAITYKIHSPDDYSVLLEQQIVFQNHFHLQFNDTDSGNRIRFQVLSFHNGPFSPHFEIGSTGFEITSYNQSSPSDHLEFSYDSKGLVDEIHINFDPFPLTTDLIIPITSDIGAFNVTDRYPGYKYTMSITTFSGSQSNVNLNIVFYSMPQVKLDEYVIKPWTQYSYDMKFELLFQGFFGTISLDFDDQTKPDMDKAYVWSSGYNTLRTPPEYSTARFMFRNNFVDFTTTYLKQITVTSEDDAISITHTYSPSLLIVFPWSLPKVISCNQDFAPDKDNRDNYCFLSRL
ncbi:uncharacterized protein LOC142347954 [Convolutriloba macropyga]|uniref:uncharacterized protein LOC142347954 n=1 Tax=Convolutriloba macropyga TaxID=536237 RepID=UPI003F528E54